MSKFWNKYWFILIPSILFIFDRIFKNISLLKFKANAIIFDFVLIKNSGISWGLFSGNSLIFLGISFILLGVIFYFYKDLNKAKLGVNLVIAGAISNILDRIFFGFIVDYINFRFFPVFNLADACIVLGGIYIILKFSFDNQKATFQ